MRSVSCIRDIWGGGGAGGGWGGTDVLCYVGIELYSVDDAKVTFN